MALDNQQGYEEINDQINALKTLKESKANIKGRMDNPTNYDVSSLSSGFPLDKSAVKSYVSSEVRTQIENLINTASNLSSPATLAYFLEKFFRAVKTIQPQLKQIVLECMVKSLGCDYEQTYQAGDVYVRVESIDIKKMLLEDPDSDIGKTLYEKTPITAQNLTEIPRSTNRLLYLCLKNLNQTISSPNLLNGFYYGGSGQPLFDISYVTSRPSLSNPAVPEYGNFFKVTLINKLQGNKVTEFLSDYFETIRLFDSNVFFSHLLNASLENFQVSKGARKIEIDDSTRFGLFVQRMLGQCLDNDEEISVSGIAKVPEVDDSSNTFFTTTPSEEIIIQEKIKNQEKGIIVLADCDNIELPISSLNEYIYNIVGNITEGTDLSQTFEQDVLNSMTNDESWSISFSLRERMKRNMRLRLLKNFAASVSVSMLTPKTLLPLMIMVKVLKKNFDDRLYTAVEFLKNFKELMTCIVTRVGAIFTKIMFNLIKKDLKGFLRAVLIDWKGDQGKLIYLAIIALVGVVKTASAFVKDFRRCKSIIDGILSLLKLLNAVRRQFVPAPLLLLSELLPGFSVNRAFLNHITSLQKMGIPTGPLPDGSPNLMLMRDFSMMEAFNREQVQNGKIEGVFSFQQIAPTGAMPAYVKVTGKYF
jgi:hypothetical protein